LLTEYDGFMSLILPHARTWFRRQSCAALLFTVAFAGAPAGAQTSPSPTPRLPELSSYDCAAATQDAAARTRHIGQVVDGIYNEWHEIYSAAGGQQRLVCLSVVRPAARQLTRAEAEAFLTSSLAVGAPTDAGRTQSVPQATEAPPQGNVQPEPLKRLKPSTPPANGAPNGAEQKSSAPELPPIPAAKHYNAPGPAPLPPPAALKERSSGAVDDSFASPQTVGVDDREPITTTQVYPWNTLAYVEVNYPTGGTYRCSGTVVSPYVVLTAGHCVHNQERGGYVSGVRVYPGQGQNGFRPYGSKTDWFAVQTTEQWEQISGEDTYFISQYRHDLGAIEFRTPFTHTATFMPVIYNDTGSPVTNAGYPAEVNNTSTFALYADTGPETSRSINQYRGSHVREFALDASGGNSGGPFIYTDPNTDQRYLVGLLSYGEELDDQSGGPWYDSWNRSLISSWISWTPTAAAGTTNGLRAASVFGSIQPNFLSFLRFYNGGLTAGTVEVTLADYDTGTVLGTWTSPSLPARSSRQFSIETLENEANLVFPKSMIYAISVRPTFTGAFQNVLWRRQESTMSNISTCDTQGTDQMTLMNVHSTLLQGGYPAGVVVHNTGASAVNVSLGVYDSATGQRLGTFLSGPIPGNGQKMFSMQAIESGATLGTISAYHYNLRADVTFTGYLQHLMNNVAAGITVDMTANCRLAP